MRNSLIRRTSSFRPATRFPCGSRCRSARSFRQNITRCITTRPTARLNSVRRSTREYERYQCQRGTQANGTPLNQYYNVPLDDYLFSEKEVTQRSIWEEMARQYVLGTRPDEITRLLNRYTNINLPVSAPAFTTLFGKPEINIGVTGSADVHLSVISTYTNLTGLSALGSTQTAPAFSQDLAVNVNGKIGDKLLMTADWNTTRTFDYENQLKVAYTGYDDEIIQSIEAGNVTLQTPSKLITGSQAVAA